MVELDHLARVDVFERDLDLSLGRLHLAPLLLAVASAATEHAEDVFEAAHAASVLDALQAVLVVQLSLFRIAQDLVGRVDLLEGGLVAALVRVVLERLLPESLLDLRLGRGLRDTQHVVQSLGVDVLLFFVHWVRETYFPGREILLGILLRRRSRC